MHITVRGLGLIRCPRKVLCGGEGSRQAGKGRASWGGLSSCRLRAAQQRLRFNPAPTPAPQSSPSDPTPPLPFTQPPAWPLPTVALNGLLSGPTSGASEQESQPSTATCALWTLPTSCLPLSVLPTLCLCRPLPSLSPSRLLLRLSFLHGSLPLLSRPPGPTLHLLLPPLPRLSSRDLPPQCLQPVLWPAPGLLPPLSLPHVPLLQGSSHLFQLLLGLQ